MSPRDDSGMFAVIFSTSRRYFAAALLILFVAGTGARAQNGIALVQHVSKDAGTTTSSTLAFNASNTAGDWIAVCVRAGRSNQVFTVSDTQKNVYRRAAQMNVTLDTPNGDTIGVFYAENVAGGANTITVSDTISGTLRFAILEYAGVATTNSLDAFALAQGSGTSPNSGVATTTANGDLLLGEIISANPAAFTAGSGYALQEAVPAQPGAKLIVETQIQAAAGSVASTATLGTSDVWAAIIAAFRPANGVAPAPNITNLNPTSGTVGTPVTITGVNFGSAPGTVTFNGTAGVPTSWSPTSIVVPVPSGATTGNVVVTAGALASTGVNFVVNAGAPNITNLNPTSGTVGTPVTITGVNFGSAPGTVTFNGTAGVPTSWSPTSIVVPVPSGATTGNVVVTAGALASTGVNFSVLPTQTGISLVQHVSKDAGTATSSTLAFKASNTLGNWIAVCVRAGRSNQVFTISDSQNNVYRKAAQINVTLDAPNGDSIGIFYAENVAGGANTVTVSDTISGSLRFAILEYAGVATANSLDAFAVAQGTGTLPSSGAATTTANGDLLLGEIVSANPATFVAGGGYTLQETVPVQPGAKLIVEDRIQAAAGSVASNATLATSDVWGAIMAAFQPANGTVAPPAVTLGATKIDFGTQGIGTASSPHPVGLSNTGSRTVLFSSITITGPNASEYGQTNDCGSSLAAGGNCTINVTFTPSAGSTRTAAVTITDNATGSPQSIALTGVGNQVCTLSISPRVATLTFTRTQQFTSCGSNVSWSVDGIAGGSATTGTITGQGLYTPPSAVGTHTVTVTSSDQSQTNNATVYVSHYPGTFTHHNDIARTGQNLNETVLNSSNVNSAQFGKLTSYATDGDSHASPLYVADVNIPGQGFHNVVYVTTEHDSLYAFDADGLSTQPLWKVSFINPAAGITSVPVNDTGFCCNSQEIGIRGTPVIDQASGTLYLVAKTKEVAGATTTYFQRLHAIDVASGAEKFGGPIVIQASVPGTGSGAVNGHITFDALNENQRPALLLNNGVVYLGFAGHSEVGTWHGWVLGYDAATLTQVMAYNTSPNDDGAGIWMSGGGLAADAAGNIYFSTGNGGFDANTGGSDYGDSFVKISPSGVALDYFTPFDQSSMNIGDNDLGSGGVLVLPDQPGTTPRLVGTSGKNGTVYLVNRDTMGHFNSSNNAQIVQSLSNVFSKGGGSTDNFFSSPTYFNGLVYFAPASDSIQAFRLTNGLLSTSPVSSTPGTFAFPGATLTISANGNANGILWAVQKSSSSSAPGVLHAFDATNLSTEFYNSAQAGSRDTLDVATKFNTPLVANGKVFVGTTGQLTIYGLLP